MAASTEDASTVFWNPAGISQGITGIEISGASLYINPTTRFRSSTGSSTLDGGDGGVSSLVPSLYVRAPLRSNVGVGLAINALFGLSTDWDAQWAGMYRAFISKSETLNINPAVGMTVGPYLSVGAGVSNKRLKAKLTNAVTPLVPGSEGRLDGSDWAWGWNVGARADFPIGTRVGLTYRSHTDYNIGGTLGFNKPVLAPLDSNVRTSLRLPPPHRLPRRFAAPCTQVASTCGLHVGRVGFGPVSHSGRYRRGASRTGRFGHWFEVF